MTEIGTLKGRVSLDDKASPALEKLGGTIARVFAIGAIVKFTKASLEAQSAQEDAINKLNLALANQGKLTEETSRRLQEFSVQLQATSRYADEVVLGGEALLASFGMNEDQILRTTQAAADFASATGKDLTTAIELLGKAYVGNTAMLSRYGIVVDENLSKQEKFESAVKQIEQRFGGSALTATKTFAGQMDQVKNAFGDTMEAVGKLLGEMINFGEVGGGLVDVLRTITAFIAGDLVRGLYQARAAMAEFMAGVFSGIGVLAQFYDQQPRLIKELVKLRTGFEGFGDPKIWKEMADGQVDLQLEMLNAGDAAADAAGKLLNFKNTAGGTKPVVNELTKEVAAFVASFTGADLAKTASDMAKAVGEQGVFDRLIGNPELLERANQQIQQLVDQGLKSIPPELAGIQQAWLEVNRTVEGGGGGIFQAFEALAAKMLEVEVRTERWRKAQQEAAEAPSEFWTRYPDVAAEAAVKTLRWSDALSLLSQQFQALGGAGNLLSTLAGGITSIAAQFERLSGAGIKSFGGFKALFSQGAKGILQGLSSGFAVAGAAFTVGKAIVGLFKSDPIAKAQKEIGQIVGEGVSRELAESMKKQADELGIALKNAVLLNITEIADETGRTMAESAAQIGQLMSAIASGAVPAEEGMAELGDVWGEALDEAGGKWNATTVAILQAAQAAGTMTDEMKEFVSAQNELMAGGAGGILEGLAQLDLSEVSEAFGTAAASGIVSGFQAAVAEGGLVSALEQFGSQILEQFEAFKEAGNEAAAGMLAPMAALQKQIGENEQLKGMLGVLTGMGDVIEGMAAQGTLTADALSNMGVILSETFSELTEAGVASQDALQAIMPDLTEAVNAARQYGYALDPATQALVDQAEAAGFAFPVEPMQQVVDLLTVMVQGMGFALPESAQAASQGIQDTMGAAGAAVDQTTQTMNDALDTAAANATSTMEISGLSMQDAIRTAAGGMTTSMEDLTLANEQMAGEVAYFWSSAVGELPIKYGQKEQELEAAWNAIAETSDPGLDHVQGRLAEILGQLDAIEGTRTVRIDVEGGGAGTGGGGGGDGGGGGRREGPEFQGGTSGLVDFGSGTWALLHNREAVLTEGQYNSLLEGAGTEQIMALRSDMRNLLPSIFGRAIRDAMIKGAAGA